MFSALPPVADLPAPTNQLSAVLQHRWGVIIEEVQNVVVPQDCAFECGVGESIPLSKVDRDGSALEYLLALFQGATGDADD